MPSFLFQLVVWHYLRMWITIWEKVLEAVSSFDSHQCIFTLNRGMTPEQAEMQYLEYAKKIALYGIHMHAAKVSFSVGSVCVRQT